MAGPFSRWSREAGFASNELAVILEALDHAVEGAPDAAAVRIFRRAQLVIWRKLWPELAEQYDDQEPEEEA